MTATKILFATTSRSRKHLSGTSGRRFAALSDMDHLELLSRFQFVTIKGETTAERRRVVDKLRPKWSGRKVVLFGREVAVACGLVSDDYEWFDVVELDPNIEAAVVPHPGGQTANWWNDTDNVIRAREFMLSARIGFFVPPPQGDKEQFSVLQIAAALDAGRGVYTWAAEALAKATGRSCSYQTVKNYIDRYPDQLAGVGKAAQARFIGIAAKNVVQAVERGDVDTSKWALTTQHAHSLAEEIGVKFERVVTQKVDGRVAHDHAGRIEHHMTPELARFFETLEPEEVDVLEGVYRKIEERQTDAARPAEITDQKGAPDPSG